MDGRDETVTLGSPGRHRAAAGLNRGDVLGRYVILRALGSGGMGIVYAAYDAELERKVALKLLRWHARRADDERGRTRLLNEAKALAKLSHPNVVQVFDAGIHGDHIFFVMELVDGETVTEWLTSAPRSRRAILEHFRAAGRGLAAIHRAGLVHRDVKPSNMVIGGDGRLRVVDLGLASAASAALGRTRVEHGAEPVAGGGTPIYMAPEQHRGQPPDARSDQFSFCVSLLDALSGPEAARRRGLRDTAATDWLAGPNGWRGLGSVPVWLRRLLQRGLEHDPDARFASMDTMLLEWERHPRRIRRLAIASVSTGVLVAMMWWGLEQRAGRARLELAAAGRCTGAQQRLIGVWDPERSAVVRSGFSALAPPHARAVGDAVVRQLDRYARNWVAMHTDICEATHLRGEQSEQLMDLRMACLEDHRRALGSTAELVATPDEGLVARALKMVAGIPTPETCADTRTLLARTPQPTDPESVAQIERASTSLARSKALEDAGRLEASLAEAEAAMETAALVEHPPLAARAHRRLAEVNGRLGKMVEMRSGLLAALAAAHRGRDDREAAQIWLDWIIVEWFGGRLDEAQRVARVAEATIDRIGGDDLLESTLHNRVGMLANRERDFEVAIARFERSRALFERSVGPHNGRSSPATMNLAIAYRGAGRGRDAERVYRDILELIESEFGDVHPDRAQVLHNLGALYGDLGEFDRAVTAAREGMAVATRLYGPDHPESALHGLGLAEALYDRGESIESLAHFEHAYAVFAQHPGDPIHDADAAFGLARALRALGREPTRQRRLSREARAGYLKLGERAKERLASVDSWRKEVIARE